LLEHVIFTNCKISTARCATLAAEKPTLLPSATPSNSVSIQDLLRKKATDTLPLKDALKSLVFEPLLSFERDLEYIKDMKPLPSKAKNASGRNVYSVCRKNTTANILFDIFKMRRSKLLYERSFYDDLYKKIFELWKNPEPIVLQGNAGIGKSLFQIYLLRRLLMDEGTTYPFVVHQVRSAFYL
jgi:hypothetical protein